MLGGGGMVKNLWYLMIFKIYFYIFCVLIFIENDIVLLGGDGGVRMIRNDFNYAKVVYKLIVMVFGLVDVFFTKEIFFSLIVYGTKDYVFLDRGIMVVVRG